MFATRACGELSPQLPPTVLHKSLLIPSDPETILREESGKTPCKRYMTIGDCAYGPGCRFSHYTPPMIWELERLGNRPAGYLTTRPLDHLVTLGG